MGATPSCNPEETTYRGSGTHPIVTAMSVSATMAFERAAS